MWYVAYITYVSQLFSAQSVERTLHQLIFLLALLCTLRTHSSLRTIYS